jgi:peptidyl-prolyl cis-trans isomerase A (cyclophilin A)
MCAAAALERLEWAAMRLLVVGMVALLFAVLEGASLGQDRRSLLLDPGARVFAEPAPARSTIRLDTSKGNIDIEVVRSWSPRGADRFVALVRQGYYDETRFFRVRPGRWVQFGINGDPAVAQAWRGRTIEDDPFGQSNIRGTVAFAFAVPNGRTRRYSSTWGTTRRRTTKSRSRPSGASSRGWTSPTR